MNTILQDNIPVVIKNETEIKEFESIASACDYISRIRLLIRKDVRKNMIRVLNKEKNRNKVGGYSVMLIK
jgi:hypothetical protein